MQLTRSEFLLFALMSIALSTARESAATPVEEPLKHGLQALRVGDRFEIVGELYAHGVALNLDSPSVGMISLVPLRLAGSEILWRERVPAGSIMRVLTVRPSGNILGVSERDYLVEIDTISNPTCAPIRLRLTRGVQGSSSTLNPSIFSELKPDLSPGRCTP